MRTITRRQLIEGIEAGIAYGRRRSYVGLSEDSSAALRDYAQTTDYAVVGTFAEVPIPGDEARRCGCPVTAVVRPLHEPDRFRKDQYLAEVDFARGYDRYVNGLDADGLYYSHVLKVID